MADFKPAYYNTGTHEGGYVSKEVAASIRDSGGETYAGVSRVYNPNWAGWPIIDAYKKTNSKNYRYNGVTYFGLKHGLVINDPQLKNLHYEYVKKKYWDSNRLGEIKNQALANFVFDIGYGSGISEGAKHLQIALGFKGTDVDGKLGSITLGATNKANQESLFDRLKEYRIAWLKKNLKGESFLDELVERANSFFLTTPKP